MDRWKWAGIVFVAFVLAASYAFVTSTEKALLDLATKNQRAQTQFAAQAMEAHVLDIRAALVRLSTLPTHEELSAERCRNIPGQVHERIFGTLDSVLEVDAAGEIRACSSPKFGDYAGVNVANKEYFQTPKETQEPYIVTVERSERKEIIVSVPRFRTTRYTPYPNIAGDFVGIFLSIIDVEDLFNSFVRPVLDDATLFLLVDEKNETILKSDRLNDTALQQEKNILTYSDLHIGQERWRLIVITPVASLLGTLAFAKTVLLALIIGLLMGGFFLIFWIPGQPPSTASLPSSPGIDVVLRAGTLYLIKGHGDVHAQDLFMGMVQRGYAGFALTREHPETFETRYGKASVSFLWLSSQEGPLPHEIDTDRILTAVRSFCTKNARAVVLIERMDYLVAQNGFEKTLAFVHQLKDALHGREALVLVSLEPELIQEQHGAILENEMTDPYQESSKFALEAVEKEILSFVHTNNLANHMVSYGDVTSHCGITKPTTRVKIQGLLQKGLLTVDQRGRFKSLRLTSLGKRFV